MVKKEKKKKKTLNNTLLAEKSKPLQGSCVVSFKVSVCLSRIHLQCAQQWQH